MTTSTPQPAQVPVTTSVSLRGPTILAVLGISVIQLISISAPEIRFICYLMPLLVLTAGAKEPTQRASTVYFLFFLSGLSSITIDAFSLHDILADSTDSNQDVVEILLASLPSFVTSALIPLVLGVAFFVILSAGASKDTPQDLSIFEKLSQWWATTDAPAEINHAVQQAISTIADLNERCQNLEQQTTKNSQQFHQLGTAADDCVAAISQFKDLAVELQSELRQLRKDLRGTQADIGQIGSQVNEMGEVLDQFAEIASHKVLQYEPEETNYLSRVAK